MPYQQELSLYIPRMKNRPILVIGDICLDRFVRGDVTRISSEAPIPVMVSKQEYQMLGQAGNTFLNLIGLGVKASILSVIGEGREGDIIKKLVEEEKASSDNLIINKASPTTVKTRYLSGHQQVFRIDTEGTQLSSKLIEDKLLEKIRILVPEQDAVILSDYGYGILSHAVIRLTIDLATQNNIPVLVDPRGVDLSKYRGATVATPNRKELAEATGGLPTQTDQQIVEAGLKLIDISGIQSVVATRAQDGMSIIPSHNEPAIHIRTEAQEVFDVSGAGDTVIATIAASLAAGASLVEAAMISNIAGGVVVGKVGTASIHAQELNSALTINSDLDNRIQTSDYTCGSKVCDWDAALEIVKKWQARGLKIGFTNGCFDIIHAGHVNYLNESRTLCDRLILGLNTDQSIRFLKGEGRPINDQNARASVVSSLESIDMVLFFGANDKSDDNTASAIIQHLKPDIYFKGGDYNLTTLPEVPIVHSYGGVIKLIKATEGFSTTSIKAKMGSGNS